MGYEDAAVNLSFLIVNAAVTYPLEQLATRLIVPAKTPKEQGKGRVENEKGRSSERPFVQEAGGPAHPKIAADADPNFSLPILKDGGADVNGPPY